MIIKKYQSFRNNNILSLTIKDLYLEPIQELSLQITANIYIRIYLHDFVEMPIVQELPLLERDERAYVTSISKDVDKGTYTITMTVDKYGLNRIDGELEDQLEFDNYYTQSYILKESTNKPIEPEKKVYFSFCTEKKGLGDSSKIKEIGAFIDKEHKIYTPQRFVKNLTDLIIDKIRMKIGYILRD